MPLWEDSPHGAGWVACSHPTPQTGLLKYSCWSEPMGIWPIPSSAFVLATELCFSALHDQCHGECVSAVASLVYYLIVSSLTSTHPVIVAFSHVNGHYCPCFKKSNLSIPEHYFLIYFIASLRISYNVSLSYSPQLLPHPPSICSPSKPHVLFFYLITF